MKKKLKIAYYCSNRTVFPPPKNLITANADVMEKIAKEMIAKGHHVSIYASKGSSLKKAKITDLDLPPHLLDAAYEEETWVQDLHIAYRLTYISKLIEDSKKFDIIHLHVGRVIFGMPFVKFSHCPVVFTIHESFLPQFIPVMNKFKNCNLVSISNAQRKALPHLNYVSTIYHGIEVEKYPFSKNPKNNLLFLARVSQEKGVESAIEVSRETKIPLDIHGPGNKNYLAKSVFPFLSKKVVYHGMTKQYSKKWYNAYKNAKVLLVPIKWEEPFGLVMIEAMACGTPVVAFARGSVPEIIKDGETGFIVNSSLKDKRGNWIVKKTGVKGMQEAVEKIYSLKEEDYQKMRKKCRKHVEEKFSVSRMGDDYEKLYSQLIK